MDIVDEANDWAQKFLERSLREQRRRSLDDDEQIQIGDDVICIDCLGPIEEQRLKFLPRAVRCVCCQQVKEKARAR